MLSKLLNVVECFFKLLPFDVRMRINWRFSEKYEPIFTAKIDLGKSILLSCPSRKAHFRARTLLSKEPDTIEWLKEMGEGDVLWDIGANVGVYSLFAAAHGIKVFAFEPESRNYALLQRNVYLNGFHSDVHVLPIAFGKTTSIAEMKLSAHEIGGSGHSVTSSKGDHSDLIQSVISYKMSDFVRDFDSVSPTHIKIDVDGNEVDILEHADQVLAASSLCSVIVEINKGQEKIYEIFKKHGLKLKSKHKQNHIFERM